MCIVYTHIKTALIVSPCLAQIRGKERKPIPFLGFVPPDPLATGRFDPVNQPENKYNWT